MKHLFPSLRAGLLLLALTLPLSGCGLWQSTKNVTVSAAQKIFLTRIDRLNLDLIASEELNAEAGQRPLAVVVRVYQLKDKAAFLAAPYSTLLEQDQSALADDLLAIRQTLLRPGAAVSLREPYHQDATYVGVVALFRQVDPERQWRLLLDKKELDNDKPLQLELRGYALERRQTEG
ncbi:type VI secretion system lipoprotein TssJ [Chromobacterium haemolyticum]|uniref:Type VI secretion system lipoprotein TssJ n=1 Tax=Chromobacterium haemolyticum TaxID=394935 RepID=A0ABS3GSP7_9NEIS|nr:type VI secretion system lipoprotein TssJ [Chromobacterium haemolyticum]MBK0416921.1 type VI secretion system lipoprotein TssJ [Chromobacterium haemolyticum]MBO0418081.1 type VI secretion system lipoprotein TssJ [Chromobacterium haemolyticum]MBO0501342.1 type VI secretion system lipoprotein TssJ [Chromobacterium haemolyticum]